MTARAAAGFAAAAAATAAARALLGPDRVERWASTNLTNLRHHPLGALAVSPFVLGRPAAPQTVLAAAVFALAGRRFGGARTLALAATGHVGGTLLSQAALAARIRAGGASPALRTMPDTGASYAVLPLAAALAAGSPGPGEPRWVRPAAAALAAASAARDLPALARNRDPEQWCTALGHATALTAGLLAAPDGGPRTPMGG